jgi:hypothetical protein
MSLYALCRHHVVGRFACVAAALVFWTLLAFPVAAAEPAAPRFLASSPARFGDFDAMLAAPIALLALIVGQVNAEIVVAFAWPLVLLGGFMFFVVRIGGELGATEGLKREAQWAAAIIAALAFPATEKFAPGSFDHHNVILVLVLASVWGLLCMREQPRAGLWVGVALGLAMATAAEAVPLVMAGLVIAGFLWLLHPQNYSAGFARLGYRLTPNWRLELEAGARAGDIADVKGDPARALPNNLCSIGSVLPACAAPEGSLQATTLMTNLLWDFMPDTTLNPFVGFGIGVANLDLQLAARANTGRNTVRRA